MTEEPPRTPNSASGRRVKKSDTLQVRIPHDTKQAFTEACREDDVAVSDRIRGWIDSFLSARERPSEAPSKGIIAMIPKPVRKRRYLIAASLAAVGATTILALPSAANTTFRAMFDQLDADRDGQVTEKEFMAMVKRRPFMEIGPLQMSPEERAELIAQLKVELSLPMRPEYLPRTEDQQKLAGELLSGKRTWESLSQDEIYDLLPVWNDEKFPVDRPEHLPASTVEQMLEMEKKERKMLGELVAKQFADGARKPKPDCSGPPSGISDAEFANPWMNSSATDMLKMFNDGDRNHDGVVEFDEFQTSQTETARFWFRSMDQDSDNKLTMQDFAESQEKFQLFIKANPNMPTCVRDNPKPRWLPLDTNGDGAVSFEEYLVPAQVLDPR